MAKYEDINNIKVESSEVTEGLVEIKSKNKRSRVEGGYYTRGIRAGSTRRNYYSIDFVYKGYDYRKDVTETAYESVLEGEIIKTRVTEHRDKYGKIVDVDVVFVNGGG